MENPTELARLAQAKAKQAAEDFEFERPWRDMVGAIRTVKSMLIKAQAMALIERAAKPLDPNNGQPPC
ncbi:MAG: hypothetical protein Q8O81_12025 [Giesbergeria sp.]|nr:hypothetical protein [Giesbergeria sp.]